MATEKPLQYNQNVQNLLSYKLKVFLKGLKRQVLKSFYFLQLILVEATVKTLKRKMEVTGLLTDWFKFVVFFFKDF